MQEKDPMRNDAKGSGMRTAEEFIADEKRAAKEEKKARKKAEKEAKKKKRAADDGHTVSEMNVEGMPFYEPNKPTKEQRDNTQKPTRKELFSMIMGAYRAYLPTLLFMVGIFTLVFLAAYLFLRSKY